jgi:RNA polymerase-binding transcription factor DksA
LAKSKKAAKKPARKRAAAARTPPRKPTKPAAAPKPTKPSAAAKPTKPAAVAKPTKPLAVAKPKPGTKPAAKGAHAAAKAPAPAKPSKAGKPAKAAPVPVPIVLPVIPKVEAPGKFRREYRRWKELLITLRHRLLSEGSHLEEEGLKALEQEVSVDHMADFGSDSSEQETTLQLIESNSISLRDVDDALKRIEAKTYGLCEDCEALIPPARLAVIPHARLCISCQSKREGMPA